MQLRALKRWLDRRRFRVRASNSAEARRLYEDQGPIASLIARERARDARKEGRFRESRYWTHVSTEIARIEGRAARIGLGAADR